MNAFINIPVAVDAGDVVVWQGMNYASRGCWQCNGGWLFAPQATGQFTITRPGVYRIAMTAQVTAAAQGTLELNLNLNGAQIPGTDMAVNIVAADEPNQVSAVAEILVPAGGNGFITVTNAADETVTINAASLTIDRIG